MIFGEMLKKLRLYRGYTQRELGMHMGFKESTADVRIAQYEAGSRFPKIEGMEKLCNILEVQIEYFTVPHLETDHQFTQLIMSLDDYPNVDLEIKEDGLVVIKLEGTQEHFKVWKSKKEQLKDSEISENEYMEWIMNWTKDENWLENKISQGEE